MRIDAEVYGMLVARAKEEGWLFDMTKYIHKVLSEYATGKLMPVRSKSVEEMQRLFSDRPKQPQDQERFEGGRWPDQVHDAGKAKKPNRKDS